MRALNFAFCSILWSAYFNGAQAVDAPVPVRSEFAVIGYLPDYRAADFDPIAVGGLTDLIVFSAEPNADGTLNRSRIKNVPWTKLRTFKTRERVRLILCVGGWERSEHFAVVVQSAEKRTAFVQSAVRLCLDERLDGMDLDWEHPKNNSEQQGYGVLLTELRAAFQSHGLMLSVTVAAWQKLFPQAVTAVDRIQVMAYDHEGQHATLEAARNDVKILTARGVPIEKIVLGLPFYGRGVIDKQRTMTYREIVAKYNTKPEVDEIDNVYFNGPVTIRRKTTYAREAGLGGVMVWELGQDATGEKSLLRVIRDEIDPLRK